MIDPDMRLPRDPGGQFQLLIKAGRRANVDLRLDDDEENAVALELRIAVPQLAQQFDPAQFKVLKKTAVVQITHGIRLRVAHTNAKNALWIHKGRRVALRIGPAELKYRTWRFVA